jgi:hypothetical protein
MITAMAMNIAIQNMTKSMTMIKKIIITMAMAMIMAVTVTLTKIMKMAVAATGIKFIEHGCALFMLDLELILLVISILSDPR